MADKGLDELYGNLYTELETYFDFLEAQSFADASALVQTEAPVDVIDNYIFYFGLDDIFEKAYKYTSIRAKILAKELGLDFNDLVFSPDEKELLFYDFCKKATDIIFRKLYPMSKNIPESYLFNKGEEIKTYEPGDSFDIGGMIYNNEILYMSLIDENITVPGLEENEDNWEVKPAYYDTYGKVIFIVASDNLNLDIVQSWLTSMEDIMLYFIMKEWYKMIGALGEYQIKEADYQKEVETLNSLLFFKQKHVRRTMGWG